MKIRIGLGVPATGVDLAHFVDEAERLKFDSLWVTERVNAPTLDPIVAMTFVAARTARMKIGASVMVLPGRNPVLLAKALASIDQLGDDGEHAAPFRGLFSEEQLAVDVEGFRVLLYRLRGRLHHYARGGGRPRGNPFNQFHFRTAALALQFVAGLALKLQMMEIDLAAHPDAPPGINWGRLLS